MGKTVTLKIKWRYFLIGKWAVPQIETVGLIYAVWLCNNRRRPDRTCISHSVLDAADCAR
jgi:hypothetical protein